MRTITIDEGSVKYSQSILKVYNYKGLMVFWTEEVDQYLDNLGIAISLRYEL